MPPPPPPQNQEKFAMYLGNTQFIFLGLIYTKRYINCMQVLQFQALMLFKHILFEVILFKHILFQVI